MAIPLIGIAARALASGGGRAAVGQAVGQAAGNAVGSLANTLADLANPLTATTTAFGMLSKTMSQMETPFKMTEAFFRHVGSYVAKFSPIRMEFFDRAVADFQAAIGKQLIPILEAGTRIFRKFGDMIVQNGAKIQPFADLVASFVEKVASAFMDLVLSLSELPGLLTATSLGLDGFTETLKFIAKYLKAVITFPALLLTNPLMAINLADKTSNKKEAGTQTARGMAYQQTTTESVTAMMSRIQQSAYGYSEGPAEKTADNTGGILKYFNNRFVPQLTTAIKAAITGQTDRTEQDDPSIANRAGQVVGAQVRAFTGDPLALLRLVMPNQSPPS